MLVEWFVDADTCKVNCPAVNIFFDTWAFLPMVLEKCIIWIIPFGEIYLLQMIAVTAVPPVTTDPQNPSSYGTPLAAWLWWPIQIIQTAWATLPRSARSSTSTLLATILNIVRLSAINLWPTTTLLTCTTLFCWWYLSNLSTLQLLGRNICFCSRGINKQVCQPSPWFIILPNRVSLLFASHLTAWQKFFKRL